MQQARLFCEGEGQTQRQKGYRIQVVKVQLVRERYVSFDSRQLSTPAAVYRLAKEVLGEPDREYFLVLCLDIKNRVLAVNTVSIGTLNTSLVHPREVFKPAILANAASVILVHNHPSGEPTPSREDLEVTKKLVQAGKLLGIEVLDHVVLGDGAYASFKEQGLL